MKEKRTSVRFERDVRTLNLRERIREYEKVRSKYVQFTEKMRRLLKELVERKRIEYYVIEGRTKSVKSFGEKIIRPEKHYTNPLNEVTDLCGIRIIVYYLDDVDKVAQLIEHELLVSPADSIDKTEILKPHEFGYRAIHYVASLSESRKDLPEWKDFGSLKAEIQIRTVLQHAWASIDQTLRYKKETDVPYQFRRKLFCLSGILELADEEFASLKTKIASLKIEVKERIEKEDIDLEINVDTLEAYMKSNIVQRLTRIARNIKNARVIVHRTTKKDLSRLVSYCSASDFSEVSELDNFLKSIASNVAAYYENIAKQKHTYPWDVTVPFLIIYLIIATHPKVFSSKKQQELLKHWNKGFLKRMVKYGKSSFPP